jgi:protein-tyrosine-phosphatase
MTRPERHKLAREIKMMNKATVYLTSLVAILSGGLTAAAQGQGAGKETDEAPVVVFVCEHGAAKSVVAAAHFNRLAKERGLNLRAIARGTNPDKEIAPKAALGLRADGLASSDPTPRKISKSDLVNARRVITFCRLPDDYPGEVRVESWDGVPSMDEDYVKARDWMVERLNRLLGELRGKN